jgi:hypothetical protein
MARPELRQRLFLSSVELVSYDHQFDSDLEDLEKAKTQDLGSVDEMCPLKSAEWAFSASSKLSTALT